MFFRKLDFDDSFTNTRQRRFKLFARNVVPIRDLDQKIDFLISELLIDGGKVNQIVK